MIKILGKRRVFFLVALLIINAILGIMVFLYLIPEKEASSRQLRSITSELSTLNTDLNNIRLDFEELTKQRSNFEALNERGFFNFQRRKEAVSVLEGLDREAGIGFSKVSIGAGEVEEHPEALKADHVVLSSPVSIVVESVDDVDVFNYVHLLNNVFPGHVSIDEFVIKRELDVTGDILRAIASGDRPKMVDARIEMTWRTMIPSSAVLEGEGG